MGSPEILAPAGSMEALLAGLRCGADAVYVGAGYSARSSVVSFSLPELERAAELCHLYHAKLHLAVNTLVTDRELEAFREFICNAAQCGIDACIVQDLGVLHLIHELIPDMPLHGSTQMSIHTPQGALQAKKLGCSRVVLARELSCEEIQAFSDLPVETEVFVHGALCMSVSGQCSFSAVAGGRSANRGQCAQACRLPWCTPNGKSQAALSLRDLSLVEHVSVLERMGVDSFKIEGRMKRPEYVAAAVTALRMALDGKQPDMKLLESVFSRNGFTDGYFTGKKQAMFGFRRKEDVLAGQQVFSEIQKTYQKPRILTELDFDLELKSEMPAVLRVSDSRGDCVSVLGDVPEQAQNMPLRVETAERYFRKLGGTVYAFRSVRLKNPDRLILSASQCNALRRDAVEKLNSIKQKKTEYQIMENFQFLVPEYCRKEMQKRLHIRTKMQLKTVLESESDYIFCIPLQLAESTVPDLSIWLESPRIIRNEENYRRRLKKLFAKGYRDLICHNLEDIQIGKNIGFALHGGFGLNCTNSLTAYSLQKQGLQDVTASYELRAATIQKLSRMISCGAYLYGRIPMMLLRICPIKAQESCYHQKNCVLTDRTGRRFPLLCNADYLELFNSEILFLGDKLEFFSDLAFWDLYFTDETPEQIREILRIYEKNTENHGIK
ncbi:MAG: U32 family peptidase, partial [Oscillospiraceae bacterium]|nr:U32 family peptidase [Oscillospiraceae bacterium]